MDKPLTEARMAWQPLTPQGVAAFAEATLGRLLLVQAVFALMAAGAVIWFLHSAWFPVIEQAIRKLPEQGEVRGGRLNWMGDSPVVLAEGPLLAVAVDLEHEGSARSPAHVQLEFGRNDFQVFSILGYLPEAYPADKALAFNRPAMEPWWGAWAPALLGLAAAATIAGLMVVWAALATLYCGPVWLVGFYSDRALSLKASWRLAGAALMPGALFMTAAILCYGLGGMDLVKLAVAGALHLVIGWIYVFIGPLACARRLEKTAQKDNPFTLTGKGESGH